MVSTYIDNMLDILYKVHTEVWIVIDHNYMDSVRVVGVYGNKKAANKKKERLLDLYNDLKINDMESISVLNFKIKGPK